MELRLKRDQKEEECNIYRCQKLPIAQWAGVGYLCKRHSDKHAIGKDAGTLKLTGAPPKFGKDPEALDAPGEMSLVPGIPEAPPAPEGLETTEETTWEAELETETQELNEALELVEAFDIEDDGDLEFATEELAQVKGQWKTLEGKRTEITKPMNAALKATNSLFKPAQNALKSIEKVWKNKLVEYRTACQQQQQALLEEARGMDDAEEIRETLVQASESTVEPEGVSFRDNWVYEVTDADQIPREFLSPDAVKISGVVKALKGKTSIPGVRVWNEQIVSSRSS